MVELPPGHAWAAAVPAIIGGVGAIAQARGGKKAGSGAPQIPGIFTGALAPAVRRLRGDILNGFRPYEGQLNAPPNALQAAGLSQVGNVLGQGQAGIDSAFRTISGAAETGLSPQDLDLALQTTNPLFEFQKSRAIGQLRESQAQGGRFFGTGALSAEGDLLSQLETQRRAELVPLALQIQNQRLGAARSLPGFLAGALGLGGTAFQVGTAAQAGEQAGLDRLFQEFLRQQPENAIGILAGLMSGTPFYQPAQAPNGLQVGGAALQGLATSPGFLSAIQQAYAPQPAPSSGSFQAAYPSSNFQFLYNPTTGQYEIH